MKKTLVVAVSLGTLVFLAYAIAQQVLSWNPPQKFQLATPGVPIAGIPYDEAMKIFERHVVSLGQLSGSEGVGIGSEGLIVTTTNPSVVPASVEGLPVFSVPPSRLQQSPPEASTAQAPQPSLESTEEVAEPELPACPPNSHRVPGEVRCRRNTPQVDDGPKVIFNPPPPGVIVLKPGGVREQADACPQGLKEVEGVNRWRFCVDPDKPERIPNLWSPPIAGIPYEQALEIHDRHIHELSKLPGVDGVGLGAEGINVYTTQPELVPKQVEGLRVIPRPVVPGERGTNSHTFNTSVRPLHGAVAINEEFVTGVGTLTGVVLSHGKPWLVFPAHALTNCELPPPCQGGIPLNQCPHDNSQGQVAMVQPPSGGFAGYVGRVQRWTPLVFNFPVEDVAAAFMDSDLFEGNGSLSADRRVHAGTSGSLPFNGISHIPAAVGEDVIMRSFLGPPHELRLRVEEVNREFSNVAMTCAPHRITLARQNRYRVLDPLYIVQQGDSGSPIFGIGLTERLVGMENACTFRQYPDGTRECLVDQNYGTTAAAIQEKLNFDAWYGTDTVNDNTVGLFNTSTAQWYIDNGNGKWDSCISGVPTTTQDQCLGAWGFGSDTPVTGDWNGGWQHHDWHLSREHGRLRFRRPMLYVAQCQLRGGNRHYFQYGPGLIWLSTRGRELAGEPYGYKGRRLSPEHR